MNLTGPVVVTDGQLFSSSSTQKHQLGTVGVTRDGRKFRYCKAGASALVVGNIIQAPAEVANHQNLTPTATAIGATTIVAALGATAATANQYAEGWAVIDTTPGLGYAYPVSGHAAVLSSGNITLNLFRDATVQIALTTNSRVTLQANPYSGVIQCPATTLTGAVVGVAVYPITAAEYGWIQTHGPGAVLCKDAIGVGLPVIVPSTTAGAGKVGSSAATKQIGAALVTCVDARVEPVLLNIN